MDRLTPSSPRRLPTATLVVVASLWLASPGGAAELSFTSTRLALPGAPVAVVPADVDGDGRLDLTLLVAYTEWDRISIEETSEIDAVEGLVEVMTVVPALLQRRELWCFRALPGGGYERLGEPIELPTSVLALEAGPPGLPVIALTDEGVSVLRVEAGPADGQEPGPRLVLEPLLEEPPVLAGSGAFLPSLGLVAEVDGEPGADLLIPAGDGMVLYRSTPEGLSTQAASRLWLPFDERQGVGSYDAEGPPADDGGAPDGPYGGRVLERHYPLPEVGDLDGDARPDLLVRHPRHGWSRFFIRRGLGDGRFAPPLAPAGEERDPGSERIVTVADVDGDGRAEIVTEEQIDRVGEDASMRQEMAEAERPRFRYRLYDLNGDLRMAGRPSASFESEGYAFGGAESIRLPGGFQDLDGDGRLDLVSVTLDISVFQLLKVLAVKRLEIGLDFHVWCQGDDGSFSRVSGLDLSGEFRVRLANLRVGHFSQFAGDFDGDGRADFVQMGRGREVTIHLGREGCRYPARPDAVLELDEEPRDLALVRVADLDGDGRSDLAVVQPAERKRRADEGESGAVHLELFLSAAGGRR